MKMWTQIVTILGASVLVAACGAAPALADKSLMPDVVLMQSESTQEAYRFAVAHPDDLTTVPWSLTTMPWVARFVPKLRI